MNRDNGQRRGHKRKGTEDAPIYSTKAEKIMRMMGYRGGDGLGKERQGIVEPIQVEKRKGRTGLGHQPQEFDDKPIPQRLEWNTQEEVKIEESIKWIPEFNLSLPDLDTIKSWLVIGERKEILDDETNFVDPEILEYILKCKSALDHFTDKELFDARSKSNPYEKIRKGIFMNRAAMKMANIDSILEFQITSPLKMNGELALEEKELLYFADVCAGPGGFSEYILWKNKWLAKGFGFTLKGDCDFKLHDFISGPPESFEPHYGENNDGDIFNPTNCRSFMEYVRQQTDNLGVHFVMADGHLICHLCAYWLLVASNKIGESIKEGFSVAGKENIQEILSKQLYLSQIMVALGILREGGHFVCKLFDVFTPFSVGLVYLMRHCFECVSLLKPITSRPANSERYLVCKWRKGDVSSVFEYLVYSHHVMWQWKVNDENQDILELVPLDKLKDPSDPFFKYIKEENNETGINQIQNLRKIIQFYADRTLEEDRQWEIRTKCLQAWGFQPNATRSRTFDKCPEEKFRDILNLTNCHYGGFEKEKDKDFTSEMKKRECRSPFNWKICVLETTKFKKYRGFFMSAGRSRIFKSDGFGQWLPLDHYQKFQMADETLVYGEIVTEYSDDNKTKTATFHIIDGLILGGKDIRGLSLSERNEWCHLFAKSMNKCHKTSGLGAFRAKELTPFEHFRNLHKAIQIGVVGKREQLMCPVSINNPNVFIQISGILFLQEVKDPWLVAMSKSRGTKYYFDSKTRQTSFELPVNASADFLLTMSNRLFWEWDKDTRDSASVDLLAARNKVHVQEVLGYIQQIERDGVK